MDYHARGVNHRPQRRLQDGVGACDARVDDAFESAIAVTRGDGSSSGRELRSHGLGHHGGPKLAEGLPDRVLGEDAVDRGKMPVRVGHSFRSRRVRMRKPS